MNKIPVWEKYTATDSAPVSGVKKVVPALELDSAKCECILQIGIFFDGTGNNEELDLPKLSHSNIARLSKVYSRELNFFSIYVPGLGTPFPLIGETKKNTDGAGFGVGERANFDGNIDVNKYNFASNYKSIIFYEQ